MVLTPVAATVTCWIEDESEDVVQERLEKLLEAINDSGVPCSVHEEIHDEIT